MTHTLEDHPLDSIGDGGTYRRFSNADIPAGLDDPFKLSRVDFDRCEWTNVRIKAIVFEEGEITRSLFRDSYLPYAKFIRCDLTGTEFRNCDLRKASFENSKLWYVDFYDCEVNYEDLIANAPHEVNLRRRFLHRLRLNALGRREQQEANRLLIAEMDARQKEAYNILFAVDDYFRRNFSSKDRWQSLGRLLLYKLESAVWGYGVKLTALFRSAIALILSFSILTWLIRPIFSADDGQPIDTASFWQSLYLSATNFTTLGGPVAIDASAKLLSILLSLFGAIFLGLFAAAAFRRIER